jgi:hypothetical protein
MFKIKRCFALAALILSFISSLANAQNDFKIIKGKVIEKSSSKPLPFSSVFIRGTAIGTVTNDNGEFTFNIPLTYKSDTLVVSCIGYQNFYKVVESIPDEIVIHLNEAILNLEEVSVAAKKITGNEIFNLAIKKILAESKNQENYFLLNGFYREIHSGNGSQTGVVECALEIRGKNVMDKMDDILIPQFRKIYDNQKSIDEFLDWKAGKNHLLLLLNEGANVVPLANSIKRTVWGNKIFAIEKLTYFNDKLVYVLSSKSQAIELKLLIDAEDYSVYRNELIMSASEIDHANYLWGEVNTKGEKCGAILDHQSYEYKYVKGKMLPYYFFRKQDFRCFRLAEKVVASKSSLSSELLINSAATENIQKTSSDKLKLQKGLINMKKPYDSAFWKHFNDIRELSAEQELLKEQVPVISKAIGNKDANPNLVKTNAEKRVLKIGNHSLRQFTRADTLFGELTPFLTCYDVKYYHLDIDIDVKNELVKGYSEITFKMMDASTKIRLDLFEYFKINSIQYKGNDLKFKRDIDAVYIDFDQLLEKGTTHSVKVSYEGRPLDVNFDIFAGAFLWQTDNNDNPWIQSLCQGYGPKGWWPVKNHISDEPDSASVSISVPENLYAISNGKLGKTESLGNGKVKYHWAVSNPINNYDIALHIGKYENIHTIYESIGGCALMLNYYFIEGNKELATKKLSMIPQMLTVYEKYFGAYPFNKDGFKIVQSPYPMEHQSCVAVGQYFDEQLILHESAHEWWGNNVSCTDNSDIWIHEAFATYAESLYIEETLGYRIGQEYLNARKDRILNDFPLIGIQGVNHFHYQIEDKYFKGALLLNTLRHLVADDKLWFSTLKGIQADFRHSSIDTKTLVKYLNEKLGSDFNAFFYQYLQTTAIPILTIQKIEPQGFKYKWSNSIDSFKLSLKLMDNTTLRPTTTWNTETTSSINSQVVIELESKYLIKVKWQ